MIPEYLERESARFALYRWEDWQRLPIEEREAGIAHHRMQKLIALHENDALNADAERRQAQATRRMR